MRCWCLGILLAGPIGLAAQSPTMTMDHGTMAMPAPLTQHARDQVAEAHRVALLLDTPEKARAAGYRPRFGDVPLQGEHWSNPQLVLTGTFDIEHPPILMFAPIDGTQKLIGVAYAYEVKQGAPTPDGFDGAAMWHEHPALALPGHRLVMTHVWFIDSPNGIFAHDNPRLAFLERGLPYPPAGWLDDATTRSFALGLSLALHPIPTASRFGGTSHYDSVMTTLGVERDSVDRMVTLLNVARAADNASDYRRLATAIGAEGGRIMATVKDAPVDPMERVLFARMLDEALSDHSMTSHP
ncbi:MAG TPA: hypothetical protein VGM77_02295 [Gemmatimonadales bacterium]|jgi:hypothetical protein